MKLQTALHDQVDFSNNEVIIADYILTHKDDILQMSVQELAKKTFTSTSAVMRLCSKLHLSGYKEFKIRFAQEINVAETTKNVDPNLPFGKDDSVGQISSQLKSLTIQTLQETQNYLSVSDMKRACSLIHNAGKVALFGVGDAYLAGMIFQTRMMRSGSNFLISSVDGEQHHLAQTLSRNDCGLLLSYTGETPPTVQCATILKQNGAKTICITGDKHSTLAKLCDITLLLPSNETKFHRLANFASNTAMEYYLNIMYSCLYVLNFDHHKNID